MFNIPSAMERNEEILLLECQDVFSQEIQRKCREFLDTHTLDGDDPLDVWYEYVKWAEQHFPECGRTENIQKLLLTCLNKFNSSEEYFQDMRFIKLWLKYAEMSENPLQIYNQLSTRGIGVQCALFYKSWADELFKNGDFKKADKVFREGLKRKAQPLNKLQSAYGNFHVAVARQMLDETKAEISCGTEKWIGRNILLGGRKLESFSEVSTGESQLITSNVLKPVENLPSRFAAICPKGIKKAVGGRSTEKNEIRSEREERNIKQVPKVQSSGKNRPICGTRLGNSHNNCKSKATDGFHCPVAVFEVPNSSQRPMYPKEKVYADNTEYSLEELRAAHYVRKEATTERGTHPHSVIEIYNEVRPCEIQRSPLKSVVDKKVTESPSSVSTELHPLYGDEENNPPPCALSDGTCPTTNLKCRNIEKAEHLHYSNQFLQKERALLASEGKSISHLTANSCKFPRSDPLLCDAEPDVLEEKGTVSAASKRNITLRARNDSRADENDQVHLIEYIEKDGSGTAEHISILPHKGEIASEPRHYTTEADDLKENMEGKNGLCSGLDNFKYEIPLVPSPGMTAEEIEQLKGTENKENEGGVPKNLDKYEMHLSAESKDNYYFEPKQRQSVFFSDTCCSQMFAHTLLSSTPARKSIFQLEKTNRTKSIGNPPVHLRTSEEEKLVGEIWSEADQLPLSQHAASENRMSMNPVNDPPHMNKSCAVTEGQDICSIAEQPRNFQSRVLHQGLSYRDVGDEINPFDDYLISQLLLHSGFVERNKGGWLKVLSKPTPRIRLPFTLKIHGYIYQVIKEIGKGSYARILCATDSNGERVALKVQKPSWLWEAYIEDQIQHRIKDKTLGLCFAYPIQVYEYSDGSIMVHEYLQYGSILKFIMEAKKVKRTVNENVIFCFMCKIIEAVQWLHSCKIIHGDLKPDNIMVRSVYPPSIQLIDFGRAIDMTLFPPKTTFTYAVTTEDFQCTEMQAKKPWTYQTDIFGILSTAHCFLFGDYMKVTQKSGQWVIQKSLPRSCQKQLWSQFFDNLLNIESCDKLPDLSYWETAMQREIDETVLNDQLKVIKNAMDGY